MDAALGARLVQQHGLRTLAAVHVADVAAFRIVRTPDELAEPAELHLELARLAPFLRTERTQLVELLLVPLERVLGLLERPLERSVELVEHLRPPDPALGDVVELVLHVRREVDVDDVREVLDQLVGDDHAHVLGIEALVLQPDVSAVLDRRDDRRVRGGTADAQLLERLHERCLGEPGRRLREVLFGEHLEHAQDLLGRELGQRRLGVGVGRVVAPFLIDADEPVEDERLAGGAQPVADVAGRVLRERLDIDPHLVEAGVGDLRRDGALPDQAVQPQLVGLEDPAHQLGRAEHGRSDGRPRAPPARSETWSCTAAARRASRSDRTWPSPARRSRGARCRRCSASRSSYR